MGEMVSINRLRDGQKQTAHKDEGPKNSAANCTNSIRASVEGTWPSLCSLRGSQRDTAQEGASRVSATTGCSTGANRLDSKLATSTGGL
uniref:Uncharacterized protein n=1 Tax=Trichuris muris TaxID=70415 RepID=A0A5S6Q9D7_TRIMR